MEYNGTKYRYLQNLQGDIVGIIDSNGNLVVEYRYDAWGKPISTSGSMADTLGKQNPFRYRGYVYDEETALYYLWHRYYSSFTIRFLNLDELGGKKGKLFSHNGFCYCNNSPICQKDETGRIAGILLGVVFLGIALGLSGCESENYSGSYSGAANCYAYALKLSVDPKTGKPFKERPAPGSFSGNRIEKKDLKKVDVKKEIIDRVVTDCAALDLTIEEVDSNAYVCQDGEWLIALAFAPDSDYHWYRKDDDGTWSHKPGITAISRVDKSYNIIYDPKECDRGEYYEFMGYYAVSYQ